MARWRLAIVVLLWGLGCSSGSPAWAAGPPSPAADLPAAASQPAGLPGGLITPAASQRRTDVQRTVFAAPFENATGKEEFDPAAAALGDLVAVMLAQQEHIAAVERQRLMSLAEEQAKSLAGLTAAEFAVKAGKLLRADTVLTGRLFLLADKLTVSVQGIDIASERVVGSNQASCRPDDLPGAALQLAGKLAEQFKLPLPLIDLSKVDASPIASLHFAKALANLHAGNLDQAVMQFMQTLDLDPDYVEAHYWMAQAHLRLDQPAHAAIELEEYLRRQVVGRSPSPLPAPLRAARLDQARKQLEQARKADRESTVPRLAPPATRPDR